MNNLLNALFPHRTAIEIVRSSSSWALTWSRLSFISFATSLVALAVAGITHSVDTMTVGICLVLVSSLLRTIAAGFHSRVYFDSRRTLKAEPVYAARYEIHQRIKRSMALHWFGSTLVMAAVPLVPFVYLLPPLWVVLFGLTAGLLMADRYSTRTGKLLASVGAAQLEA
ncbi:hypothetical protein [Lysobacter sp. Root559]|uniref:hypothetical protein n=1 Tax=Lysobacter sp. Root559 TaxID=1736559 RepID=UPI0012FA9C61|nr:hypothetical protein [Lysobacter sp. Root559]